MCVCLGRHGRHRYYPSLFFFLFGLSTHTNTAHHHHSSSFFLCITNTDINRSPHTHTNTHIRSIDDPNIDWKGSSVICFLHLCLLSCRLSSTLTFSSHTQHTHAEHLSAVFSRFHSVDGSPVFSVIILFVKSDHQTNFDLLVDSSKFRLSIDHSTDRPIDGHTIVAQFWLLQSSPATQQHRRRRRHSVFSCSLRSLLDLLCISVDNFFLSFSFAC